MVSIWSCLSVVKISRKISIQLFQVLLSAQLPQTLQIVLVEEKMTQLLSCSGEFISQDCSLVEERSVEITVEVDATNNGAHGVKAYENFPIVSQSEKKNTRDKLKRNYKSISVLTLEDLQQHFGSKLEAVAKSFGVSKSTLKRKCRRHEISRWPFQPERKKERLMEVISPSMHEKHDLRLQSIRTPLHARSSPRTIALPDGGEVVQLDSSKQQSLVEFDVTNNSAHLVRASQNCSTVSHSDDTNSRETLKRKCTTESVLSFEDLQQHFGCKRDDAAKALGVSISTVKRTCRQHGILRWPSRKKRKVSKTDCILLEPQGEKDVSPSCSKMPTDWQTERGNEMGGYLQDQNEGPNLSNTENGSNEESITTLIFQDFVPVSEMDCILLEPEEEKNVSPTCMTPTVGIVLDFVEGPNLSNTESHSNEESITTPTFQDSVHVFERDCVLLEPQGEKNVSPTHKTPTNGQTEVGNGMVRHIQDQNGIVPEFIEGLNLSNTKNCSNEKNLTTPNFQDSVPENDLAMDFSILSTYRESGEVGGSKDSRNFSTSAVGILMGGHVSKSSWTMPLCFDQAPMQTMTTIPHIMPHLIEKQDIRTMTFKAQYRDKKIKFRLSLPSGIVELKKQVTNRLGELGNFEVHYQDNDNEWILIGCDTDVWDCFELSSSSGNGVVRLLVRD
ncbi:Protein NLP7 [Camellia lanceoleosa]|uniref:Protein NLP7 n=1 Tax=Camellia lanceoleosa TaxID=1840588 RepID=A0ACC0GBI5_9ERIC|nr:Protein NLP7 [Camellia lanceoleosa]